jgi:hypothetical protein
MMMMMMIMLSSGKATEARVFKEKEDPPQK